MDRIIEFKTHNLKLEFLNIDNRLQAVLYALAGFVNFSYGKPIIITELMRTQEQQDMYYKENPAYKENPWQSVHQYGRGADISLKYLLPDEIKGIMDFLNHFVYSAEKFTGLIHDIGLGNHLHVQVNYSETTILVKDIRVIKEIGV